MVDSRSDQELMLGVRGGDLHALGLLYERHRDKVHRLCLRMTGDPSRADDLVQEAFLRVLKYGHSFKGNARFTTWMYRIARNATLREIERDTRREEIENLASRDLQAEPPSSVGLDRSEWLDAALANLPAEQREVLILSRFHGLRYEEIAEVCECSVEAVKSRVYRAMRTLRNELNTMESPHDLLRTSER